LKVGQREQEMFNHDSGNSAAVAAQLVEAACRAREGDSNGAKLHIARAIALLRGQPNTTPAIAAPLNGGARQIIRGGLTVWQARRLAAYIDAHLAERLRIEDLAAQLPLSVGHFCRSFKLTFGLSAHDYLTRRRIEVAQGLMLTTHNTLAAIAVKCGMSDQSHFTRWFRRIVGETPDQWRRTRRGSLHGEATELVHAPPPGQARNEPFQPKQNSDPAATTG
jgi:AraC-like DNA-binding protein